MKVVHACLSCWYVDGFGYQENELVAEHLDQGHDVVVVASTEVIGTSGSLSYLNPGEYISKDGIRVIRLRYVRFLPAVVGRKFRAYEQLRRTLVRERPDVIFFHGCSAWALLTVARHARRHPNVIFNVDSHEDSTNSARTAASRLLHRYFYGPIARRTMAVAGPALCVTTTSMEFLQKNYRLTADQVEFFPIGGHVHSDVDYVERRSRTRADLGLEDRDVAVVQAGKMTTGKRLASSLKAFRQQQQPARLFIVGSIPDDQKSLIDPLIAADPRVTFLGWKSPSELRDLLCAADVYLQPGTQSATMQQSLCSRCAVIINDMPSHIPFIDGNGWLVSTDEDLVRAISEALADADRLEAMKDRSLAVARRTVDYSLLAERALRKPSTPSSPQPGDTP